MVSVVRHGVLKGKEWTDLSSLPLDRYYACKAMARGYAESRGVERSRLGHARAFCASAIATFWRASCEARGASQKLRVAPGRLPALTAEAKYLAKETGRLVSTFPVEDAGYLIGSIYTVMLPDTIRSSMGAYYTPPPLVDRLLDLAEAAGFDFSRGSAIDPACGGGAFLAPLALRMIQRTKLSSPEWTLRLLGRRLKGIELDPFAAWMTQVFLEAAVLPLCIAAKRRMPDVVEVRDALKPADIGQFDLVIGNPPYGRVKLDERMRKRYARSLYGHANLYGLFTDLALRLLKPNGVLAYLTPTSFLGGQYFKSLRKLLTDQMNPVAFDFVADRNGVFDDVLQETLLTSFTKEPRNVVAYVSALIPQGLNAARSEQAGAVEVDRDGNPWLLPRSATDAKFLRALQRMPTRLRDLGYDVSTGPLVWNRHKMQLREASSAKKHLPLIWAESVSGKGFVFSADRRMHVPYIEVYPNQNHLITRQACVLVQRTTSKEQNRRLLAATMPQTFLDQHGGAVVENHLNMVYSTDGESVCPETIAALLNSAAVDRAFRCISGSVAVSAYELNALPLPSLAQLQEIEDLLRGGATRELIDRKVSMFYGEN